MALRVSTTGSTVVLDDLGITVTHPTSNRDLALEFTALELRGSDDLSAAVAAGDLEVDDGTVTLHATEYSPDELLLQELGLRGGTKYISNNELGSIGATEIRDSVFPIAVNSTAQSTRNIYVPTARWVTWELEIGDLVSLVGNPASGLYTVESISDQQNFIVVEAITDETGGSLTVYDPVGATRIGVDPEELNWTDGTDLQTVLDDLVIATSSGINEVTHRELDQLVHIIAEDSHEELTYSGNQVTSLIVWTDTGKTTKIREEQYTYTSNKITTLVQIQYDASGLEEERITETFTYSGNQVISIDRVLT